MLFNNYFSIEKLISAGRYFPTILKLSIFGFLDWNGRQDLTGEFGIIFAEVSLFSFLLGLDLSSMLHRYYLASNIGVDELIKIQLFAFVLIPGSLFLGFSLLGLFSALTMLTIISELLAQELYRNSMVFSSLKTYTTLYVIKNSLPILLYLLIWDVRWAILLGNLLSIIWSLAVSKGIYVINYKVAVKQSQVFKIYADCFFNLPNSFLMRSLDYLTRRLFGSDLSVQSKLNYVIQASNGIISIYDVFIVNVNYKNWMQNTYSFVVSYKIHLITFMSSILFISMNYFYPLALLNYSYIFISIHSIMMNNLASSRASLYFVVGVCFSFFLTSLAMEFIIVVPLILMFYQMLNLNRYEKRYRINFYH